MYDRQDVHVNAGRYTCRKGGSGSERFKMEEAKLLHGCLAGYTDIPDQTDLDLDLPDLKYCRTPLQIALDRNHHGMLQELLESGADANRRTELSDVPIMTACERGSSFQVIDKLLEYGATVDTGNKFASTLLQTACTYCTSDAICAILDRMTYIETNADDSIIHIICRRGLLQVCVELIQRCVDINKRNVNGAVPLHEACKSGHIDIVTTLIQAGASLEMMTNDNKTALAIAVETGNCDLVTCLLDFGADWTLVDAPLLKAYCSFNAKLVKILLNEGIQDENVPVAHLACLLGDKEMLLSVLDHRNKNDVDTNGQTILHLACRKKNDALIDICFRYNVEIDKTDKNKETALHIAAKAGNESLILQLLERGATVTLPNRQDSTPIDIACSLGRLDLVKMMLYATEATGNILHSCLDTAITMNHAEIVRYLLSATTIKTKLKDDDVETWVKYASEKGNTQTVDLMISQGLVTVKQVRDLVTQNLTQLCWTARLDLFQWLWKLGVSVNRPLEDNRTALHFASQYGLPAATHALLLTGARPNVIDDNGLTPLHLACSNNHLPICKYLISNGARVSQADNDGTYPIHYAAEKGSFELVNFLLEQGADPVFPTKNGTSPLHYAARAGNLYTVLVLLMNGGNPNLTNNCGKTPMTEAVCGLFSGPRTRTVLRSKESSRTTIVFTSGIEVLELLLVIGADPSVKNIHGDSVLQAFLKHHVITNDDKTVIDIFNNDISRMVWDLLQDFALTTKDTSFIMTLLPEYCRYAYTYMLDLIQSCCGLHLTAPSYMIAHIHRHKDPKSIIDALIDSGMIVNAVSSYDCDVNVPPPPKLICLCRATIRGLIRQKKLRMSTAVQRLDTLPKALRNYLDFH